MRVIILTIGLTCGGCAVDPAHVDCERRLVPINAASVAADQPRGEATTPPADAKRSTSLQTELKE